MRLLASYIALVALVAFLTCLTVLFVRKRRSGGSSRALVAVSLVVGAIGIAAEIFVLTASEH
jgi:hypothetical protein